MTVLLLAVLSLTASFMGVRKLDRTNRDRRLAEAAIRSYSEQITAVSDASRSDPAGWAQAMTGAFSGGGVPGNTFEIDGLHAPDGFPSVGTIRIITDETVTDQDIGFDLGLPRDLDGDGLADNTDVANTASLLPVLLQLRWARGAGTGQLVYGFYILDD